MPKPAVAIVDAKTPGNVGTIARAMKNFGFETLLLVDPPDLDPDGEAYGYAGQAREDVLPNAREVTFEELVSEYHTVGFTGVTNEDDSKHVRFPYVTPGELAASLSPVESETVFVFGRERVGLTNEELAAIDQVCAVPASAEYPSLNLGQAATVALYELRELAVEETQLPDREHTRATETEIEGFYEHFGDLLEEIEYPAEKRAKTERLIRRVVGRAHPTGREIATLRGVLRRAIRSAEDR